jgi:dihydrofolate synthase/folylpolyglutamate synthase
VDVAVLEVGLGGRFDSTNVCDPLVSIITNVSYDHMAILGDRLAEIAYQKAGIIKRGVPVVTTSEHPDVLAVIEGVATESHARLKVVRRDFGWKRELGRPYQPAPVWIATDRRDYGTMPFGLFGTHQGANAAAAVAAVEEVRAAGVPVPDAAIAAGLRDGVWPARLELVRRQPTVVLDCAHNVASAAALVETLRDSFPVTGRRGLVLATSNDKQIPEILGILAPAFDRIYLTRYQSNPRSADPATVAEQLAGLGKTHVTVYSTPADAWRAARSEAAPEDAVVVAGSVFLAGELRPLVMADQP